MVSGLDPDAGPGMDPRPSGLPRAIPRNPVDDSGSRRSRNARPHQPANGSIRSERVADLTCHPAYARLLSHGTEVGFRPNSTLAHAGDPIEDVLVVVSGVLKARMTLSDGRTQLTGLLRAGDLIGLDQEDRYAQSIEAATMGRVRRIPRGRFEQLVRQDVQIRDLLTRVAADQIAAAREQLAMLHRRSAEGRVAALLLYLAGRGLLSGQPDDLVWWPMTYVDMADYLGLTQETICRCLARLRQGGLIRQEARNNYRLLDRARLSALAAA